MNKLILILICFCIILKFSNGFHTSEITKRKEIQQSSFQFITAAAYRNAQASREWCEEDKYAGGRPYQWSEFRTMVINYLDLYVALQFDPDCDSKVNELRALIVNQEVQPAPFVKNSWWDDIFLPLALDSFTCGFTGSKIADFDFVSDDLINKDDFDTDVFKQKIWDMIGTYQTGIYKQRENANRRLDFDAGLYIPFLDKYTGGDYTTTQQMRVGFPTYLGRTLWNVFHTLAQRVSDSACESTPQVYVDLTDKFKRFFVAFPLNHACPFCREHMISKVLVNDRYVKEEYESEALRFFPIEHLLLGGTGGDISAKISTVTSDDKRSMAAFFWKLHNAVTSSVEQGCQCFTEEAEDIDPYHCEFSSKAPIQARYPRQQRSYPFAKRFEFILTPNHNYTLFKSTRKDFIQIATDINKLDTVELRIDLVRFWNNGTKISDASQSTIEQLMALIANITTQFLDTPILSQAYSFPSTSLLNCTRTQEFFDGLNKTGISEPNYSIPRTPEFCLDKLAKSSCEAQYLVTTKEPVIKEESSANNNTSSNTSSKSISTSINYLFFITIIITILNLFI